MSQTQTATRGFGLLENLLARKRSQQAERLIRTSNVERGSILDIGCGHEPLFLQSSGFRRRVGIDQQVTTAQAAAWEARGITLIRQDMEVDDILPFPDGQFDAVTMLAVFEHIELPKLKTLVGEIRRVLKPGGCYILTTPAYWTDPILWALSKIKLLSAEEVDEHEKTHSHASIADLLVECGFSAENSTHGSFELGMNLWACARK